MGSRAVFLADFDCLVCYKKAKELMQRNSEALFFDDERMHLFGSWKGGADYAPEMAIELMSLYPVCHEIKFILKTEHGEIQQAIVSPQLDGYPANTTLFKP